MRAFVVGAGIAGLTLAWWLRRDGWDVTLVERAEGPRPDGYMMDLFGSGYDVAERMGLLPALHERHTRIAELAYLDPAGRRTGGVRYATMTAMLRGRVVSLMRGELEEVLRGAYPDVRYGTGVTAIEDGYDLVAGADGIHSTVRALAFGPERRFIRPLGFHTASYLLHDPDLRRAVGDRFAVVAAPGRQAGLYPTEDGLLAASLIHRGPRTPLAETYRGLGPLVDRALEHIPEHGLYHDEVAQIELTGWSRGHVVLVGDACQAVSLMAGQGASMAMGGAWTLADRLRAHPGDIPAALAAYERRMLPFVRRKQRNGRRTAAWMVPDSRWRIGVRDRLMGLADLPGGPALMRPSLATAAASVVHDDMT